MDEVQNVLPEGAGAKVPVRLVGDRLYGVDYKPHELSMYGERVNFHLRWSPIADDLAQSETTHYRLLVLEITAEVPEDAADPRRGQVVELLKIGWECELETDELAAAQDLDDPLDQLRHALTAAADTVNELARRAGYEAPLGTDVVDSLLAASQQGEG